MPDPLTAEVQEKAHLLRDLTNDSDWSSEGFDLQKSACLCLLSELAYCTKSEAEEGSRRRVKIVPSRLYARALASSENCVQIISRADFGAVDVIHGRRFIALLIKVDKVLLIGIRGSQFAYDWRINLSITKRRSESDSRRRFHEGFLCEALILRSRIGAWLIDAGLFQNNDLKIFVAGHSLGGAIAALMYQLGFHVRHSGGSTSYDWADGCYVFAAPKIGDLWTLAESAQPFAIRRSADIVPHVPPGLFNFSYFFDQRTTDGRSFEAKEEGVLTYAKWLWSLASGQAIADHAMEAYRDDVFLAARTENPAFWHSHEDGLVRIAAAGV